MPGMRMSIRTTSGRCSRGQLDRLGAVGGLADDLEVAARSREHPEAGRGAAPGRRRAAPGSSCGVLRRPRRRSGSTARDPEAAAGAGAGGELPPSGGDPLAHADQAVPAAVRRSPARPVRSPGRRRRRSTCVSRSRCTARSGPRRGAGPACLCDVGERLLHDPVGGQVDGRGQRRAALRGATSTGSPARRKRSTSSVSRPGRAPARSAPRGRPDCAQQAARGAQLVQRGAAGLADVAQRLLGLVGAAVHDVARPTPACTLISAMWWATTSCSSRAMRSRSSATRRRASSSRVRSARSARSADGVDEGAAAADGVAGGRGHAASRRRSRCSPAAYQGRGPETMAAAVRTAGEQADPPGGGPVGGAGQAGRARRRRRRRRGRRAVARASSSTEGEGAGDGEDGAQRRRRTQGGAAAPGPRATARRQGGELRYRGLCGPMNGPPRRTGARGDGERQAASRASRAPAATGGGRRRGVVPERGRRSGSPGRRSRPGPGGAGRRERAGRAGRGGQPRDCGPVHGFSPG